MKFGWRTMTLRSVGAIILAITAPGWAARASAQGTGAADQAIQSASPYDETTNDHNQRLADINRRLTQQVSGLSAGDIRADYRIGPEDQLDISVLEASELDRASRVSASGEISLGLVGTVRAAGLTARELEIVIEELLRRSYIKEPHVSVQVREMQSHRVSVFGAVKKPGVFQIRGPKTVVELLSMAEGLDVNAGDTVIVEHHADLTVHAPSNAAEQHDPPQATPSGQSDASTVAPPNSPDTVVIDLQKLLNTGDPSLNVLVYPGDVVKVPGAKLVYVVGEVAKPGGFELKNNENVSVLQAIALAQGLTHTSASSHSRIIRTDAATGKRQEIPINLDKILAGKVPDPTLEPRDIVFVPNSTSRMAFYRGMDAAISIGSGVAIYRP
jgi:polysaccharide export outer membrane protein